MHPFYINSYKGIYKLESAKLLLGEVKGDQGTFYSFQILGTYMCVDFNCFAAAMLKAPEYTLYLLLLPANVLQMAKHMNRHIFR